MSIRHLAGVSGSEKLTVKHELVPPLYVARPSRRACCLAALYSLLPSSRGCPQERDAVVRVRVFGHRQTKRGGNRQTEPTVTAPQLDSTEQRLSYRLANDHLLSLFSFAYLIRRPVTLLPAQGVVKRSSDGVIVALPVGAADHATCKSLICMLPRCGSDRGSRNGCARGTRRTGA